mmetsp:Transcript_130233/g.324719  ORF Transcript_130233/g.324719 Transcript_130233/m.324719 type:complete len:87 (-) Transcript_130233:21-281(-)
MSAESSNSMGCGAESLPPMDFGTSVRSVCDRALTIAAAPDPSPSTWYALDLTATKFGRRIQLASTCARPAPCRSICQQTELGDTEK